MLRASKSWGIVVLLEMVGLVVCAYRSRDRFPLLLSSRGLRFTSFAFDWVRLTRERFLGAAKYEQGAGPLGARILGCTGEVVSNPRTQ